MADFSIWGIMSLAFSLGMMHALDADHVVAVSGLGARGRDWKQAVAFSARWAIGHGGALMIIGAGVYLLGMAIPESLSAWTEKAVGLVLILIGGWVIQDLVRKQAHLHFHSHDDFPKHAHWHTHDARERKHHGEHHRHEHAPVMVGVLHGVAGSAPLLALLPLTQMDSPWLGMFYLLMFSLGVFMAMLLFGGVLGGLLNLLQRWGQRLVTAVRLLAGLTSIGFGLHLLYRVVA